MEKHWLRREGNDRIVVFMLGWAAGPAVVEHIRPEGCDIVCFCDYGDLDWDGEECIEVVKTYADKYLFAWSFGVVIAEIFFDDVSFRRAVAFNGTPLPLDEKYGIGRRRFNATAQGIMQHGAMDEFERRAYGEHYERFRGRISSRGLYENAHELGLMEQYSCSLRSPVIQWDKAIVGERDVIFPPKNMLNYWGERAELLPLPHYPFADADIILREIDNR